MAEQDVHALLAEVGQLRAENEALVLMGTGATQMATGAYKRLQRMQAENVIMRVVIMRVAQLSDNSYGQCAVCGEAISNPHTPECPVGPAQELMQQWEMAANDENAPLS